MDCEKFDQIIIDAVYEELDELTLAAAKRHADTCQHCQSAWSGLRATRKIGILPLVEAPAGMETRILAAARDAHRNLPLPKRVGRAVSWAGSYAMRPQMAMAALLLLMVGSSIIFVRAKPERSGALGRISVTERGVPEQQATDEPRSPGTPAALEERAPSGRLAKRDEDRGAAPAAPAPSPLAANPMATVSPDFARAPEGEARALKSAERGEPLAPVAAARPRSAPPAAVDEFGSNSVPQRSAAGPMEKKKGEAPGMAGQLGGASAGAGDGQQDVFAAATDLYNAGRFVEAEKAFDEIEASRSKDAARAALMAGKSAESAFGCGKAAPKYEAVWSHYSGTSWGPDALWLAANCYSSLGNYAKARDLYVQLRGVAGYRDKAEGRLANLNILQQQQLQQLQRRAPAKPASPKTSTDVMK